MVLRAAFTFFAALMCSLIVSPEPTTATSVHLAAAQRLVLTPEPTGDDSDECALGPEVDADDETGHHGDDVPPCDVASTFAHGATRAGRTQRIVAGELTTEESRLASSPHLARGPPSVTQLPLV